MRRTTLVAAGAAALALVFLAPAPARAEGPTEGTRSTEDAAKELARKISRALKENEEALTRLARGGAAAEGAKEAPKAEAKPGKPLEEAKARGEQAKEDMAKLLQGSAEGGRQIVSGILELLKLPGT